MPPIMYLLLGVIPVALAIWFKSWIPIWFGSPLIVTAPISMHFIKLSNDTRFYIDGSSIYVAGLNARSIDSQRIKGIKIMQLCSHNENGNRTFYRYKNGMPIYMMILLKEISPIMYNYTEDEYIFKFQFGEYIIEEVQFDPEAVKYLKTLNPDIKVFY